MDQCYSCAKISQITLAGSYVEPLLWTLLRCVHSNRSQQQASWRVIIKDELVHAGCRKSHQLLTCITIVSLVILLWANVEYFGK
jgi:hypothetical protein